MLTGTRLNDWRNRTTTATSARRSSFIFILQGNCEIGVIKVHPASLGQHNRLIVKLKSTLDCNLSGRLTFLPFPLCWTFSTITRAEHLWGGNGLGPIFHLSDSDNIGDPHTLLNRGLSHNRRPTLATPNHPSEVSRTSFRRPQQHHRPSLKDLRLHHIPQAVPHSMGRKQSLRTHYLQCLQHSAALKSRCL